MAATLACTGATSSFLEHPRRATASRATRSDSAPTTSTRAVGTTVRKAALWGGLVVLLVDVDHVARCREKQTRPGFRCFRRRDRVGHHDHPSWRASGYSG